MPSQVIAITQWRWIESGAWSVRTRPVHLPLRGQRWLEIGLQAHFPQLPVELQRKNHAASTNNAHCSDVVLQASYNGRQMAAQNYIDQITERVERLLLRHEELQRTNTLLAQQVRQLTQERDHLKTQTQAARARLDALLQQLPDDLEDSAK